MLEPELTTEVVRLLQRLIRLDTTNPPGNETAAAELLASYLASHGVRSRIVGRAPERGNLVARIRGSGDGPTLMLLGHTDTVGADPAEWRADPWEGELRDGEVWGRGAIDMKHQVAAGAVTMVMLSRMPRPPAGDVIFAAVADEEVVGSEFGLSWICEHHPELVRADFCIDEGAGHRVSDGDKTVYTCSIGEKAAAPFVLRVHGRSGHASKPALADNALVRAAELILRLGRFRPEPRLTTTATRLLAATIGAVESPHNAMDEIARRWPALSAAFGPMLAMTVAPTMVTASEQRNVIPARCDVICDCRLLPGQTQEDADRELRKALGDGPYELVWERQVGGSASELDSPLWKALEDYVAGEDPGAKLVPIVTSGFCDSYYLRQAFGTEAYGCFPMRRTNAEQMAKLMHGPDERVHIDDLVFGTRALFHSATHLDG